MMDLSKITTGQLHAMHVTAARDCHAALERAEAAAEIMNDLCQTARQEYDAAAADFRILFAKARELREQSSVLYSEICRRARVNGERAVYDAMRGARDA